MPGTLYIVAAPSGAGKTSLVRALLETVSDLMVSVSHTTRPARVSERDGINYHFVSAAEFEMMRGQDAFLEHAVVFGNHYGTSRAWVEQKLAEGVDVILEIDWQGAQQIRAKMPQSISIFILPPSLSQLEARLNHRGEDGAEVIAKRMQAAKSEIVHYKEFDYLVVNEDFDRALLDMRSIVLSRRLLIKPQSIRLKNLLSHLLEG